MQNRYERLSTFNATAIKKYKKRQAAIKARRIGESKAIVSFSDKLNDRHIKSEAWFSSLWFWHPEELKNEPFLGFIPDIICHRYKYIIEIDGSIHDLERIKAHDRIKDKTFTRAGYRVFRIKAYDTAAVEPLLRKILDLRGSKRFITRKKKSNSGILSLPTPE